MGLDHGITRKHYVKNWDYMKPEERTKITVKRGGKNVPYINTANIRYIEEDVITLRKANAIHSWFVQNVQDGQDNCEDHWVSYDKLDQLRTIIRQVLKASKLVKGKIVNGYRFEDGGKVPIMEDGEYIEDSSVAAELLPTGSGFFFGSTDYDEWYYKDLEDTLTALDEALKTKEGDFYYWSSW